MKWRKIAIKSRDPCIVVKSEASVVAAVEAVDHVLDALDVAPVGGLGAGAVGCGGAGGLEQACWGAGGLLVRLHAACGAGGQPEEGISEI